MIDIFQWRSSIGSWYCQNVKGTSNCTAPGWIELLWYRDQEVDNLTFFLVFLLLLLILSGDVELNPGPKRDISNVLKMAPDKHTLINLLADVSNKWEEIGLALKVTQNFLGSLSSTLADNIKLARVIENWISTQSSPVTWETMISTIEGPIINNKSKADELRHHLETSIVLQNGEATTFSEQIDMETHSLLPEEQSERNSDLGLEDDDITSEILISDSNTTSGKAIPLCLPNDCVWDKKSKTYTIKQIERNSLVINEEAVKILEGITNPICVIVVVGPYRSGKSYLLNQLIPSKESVFELGHTMVSKTKGIWMWDTPFQHTLKSGKKVTIILLDTEGVDAIESGTRGDTQVFTLSVLLSSLLVYNSTQVSKRENLNQMTFIVNLAKSIASRGPAAISSFKRIAPSFFWVLRDVLLQPVNSQGIPCNFRDYLLEEILAPPKHFPVDDIQSQASKYLLDFFTHLDAETIPPPSTKPHIVANIDDPRYRKEIDPDFFQKVEQVCAKILNECQPKRGYTEGSLMNGIQFTEMLKIYVEALNSEDGIPRIGSAWDQAMKNLYEFATSRAKEMYKEVMSNLQFPIEESEIQKRHQEARERSTELFKLLTELDGDRDAYQKNFDELDATFATYSNGSCNGGLLYQYCKDNKQESQKKCQELLGKLRLKHLDPVLENLSHKTTDQEIANVIDEIEKTYKEQSKGPAQEDELNKFKKNLKDEVKRLTSTIQLMKTYDEQLQNKKERLEQAEQNIEAISQQKNNFQQTNINLEARLKELQACFEEQQRINENLKKTITRLWIILVCVCVILFSVIIYR